MMGKDFVMEGENSHEKSLEKARALCDALFSKGFAFRCYGFKWKGEK